MIKSVTIIGTGLIGGSFALALKKRGFGGRIVGCDRATVLEKARRKKVIDKGVANPVEAVRGNDVVFLATPVGALIELIGRLGPELSSGTLLVDAGSTKVEVLAHASKVFGKQVNKQFLACHPMAGKEQSGVEFADPDLFESAAWFVTPSPRQKIFDGASGEFLEWVERIGARIISIDAAQHDQLCAWISHTPQMISTALAAALVDEFGEGAPLWEAGGRALREMTRLSASPYSMWRDVALTNKQNIWDALLKLEQRLAHIRENLDTRELAREFERAHELRKALPRRHGATGKTRR